MTQGELKEEVFKLTHKMIEKDSYIKGYGSLFRVMDSTHSPVINITKQVMDALLYNDVVSKDGLIWTLSVLKSPFTHYLDVQLPTK